VIVPLLEGSCYRSAPIVSLCQRVVCIVSPDAYMGILGLRSYATAWCEETFETFTWLHGWPSSQECGDYGADEDLL
jgi:hypothetical protein